MRLAGDSWRPEGLLCRFLNAQNLSSKLCSLHPALTLEIIQLAEVRAENAEHRAALSESEESLHKLRLRLQHALEGNQEASASFEREAFKLDSQLQSRRLEEEKANQDLRQLEKEISLQMRNIARLEREQRQLRQELRDL